ncbi:MAG: magnesium transporter [Planctomycetota bacterium]
MTADGEPRQDRKDLEEALAAGPTVLAEFVREAHPADLAEWIDKLEETEARAVLGSLDAERQAELLRFADDGVAEDLLALIDVPRLAEIVEKLPADEVVDLLALADEAKSEAVLRRVDRVRATDLRELLDYEPESAGGVMTSEYVAVPPEANVGDVIKELRAEEGPAGEEEVGVFVVDGAGRPVGYVSDRDLLTTQIHTPIAEVMDTDLIVAHAEDDQEEAAKLVAKYNLSALPVVDDGGVMVGVISAEDAHQVLQEEAAEDIYRLVGTSIVDPTRLPVHVRVRRRLPLQAVTVAGGLLTAHILKLALGEGTTLPGTEDVLRFLPIVIGVAGNVGIQSSTILVRAFATGEVSPEREVSVVGTEMLTGLVIGLICGLATFLVAAGTEMTESAGATAGVAMHFGAAVGLAIVVAVTWASFLGCAVPILCKRSGLDPAVVAGPFLIALSDVSGAAIFLGVASVMAVGLVG